MKRKILISSLIIIYTFACLNVVLIYTFHNFIHEYLVFTISENLIEHKDSCDGNCTLIKALNKTEQCNSSPDIKIPIESLALHLISDFTIPIPDKTDHFRNIEHSFEITPHLSRPTPPPEKIS